MCVSGGKQVAAVTRVGSWVSMGWTHSRKWKAASMYCAAGFDEVHCILVWGSTDFLSSTYGATSSSSRVHYSIDYGSILWGETSTIDRLAYTRHVSPLAVSRSEPKSDVVALRTASLTF